MPFANFFLERTEPRLHSVRKRKPTEPPANAGCEPAYRFTVLLVQTSVEYFLLGYQRFRDSRTVSQVNEQVLAVRIRQMNESRHPAAPCIACGPRIQYDNWRNEDVWMVWLDEIARLRNDCDAVFVIPFGYNPRVHKRQARNV